jgi:hypothetical protein
LQKKKKKKDQEGRVTPVKKPSGTPHKANKETSFKPAAPFKYADDFGWLVPDDYEVPLLYLLHLNQKTIISVLG